MDPYKGIQCIMLSRDGTCDLEAAEFAGFVWVSLKAYLPSREQCKSAKKGPPILSPFSKYNALRIPTPEEMKCTAYFGLRCHVSQAKDIAAANPIGVANAQVEVHLCGRAMSTHVVKMSNNPTWDTTLGGKRFNEIQLPCLAWPGCTNYDNATYSVKDEDAGDEIGEFWLEQYHMLRAAPRIEVRVVEKVSGKSVMLGHCYIAPEQCFHTQQDPQWVELFKGNPEVDEGRLLLAMQLIHSEDPLYKSTIGDLVPQRTDEHNGTKQVASGAAPIEWAAEDVEIPWVDNLRVPNAYFDRRKMPSTARFGIDAAERAEVTMREAKIQVQVLGLRDMVPELKLNAPSLYMYVQTTEKWDGDPMGCKHTREWARPTAFDPNFKEQFELEVLLPDDAEYAPSLEFLVFDTVGLFGAKQVVAWGSVPLSEFYPQAIAAAAEDNDDDEDEAAMKRKLKQERRQKLIDLTNELLQAGTISAKDAKTLQKAFFREQGQEEDGPVSHAFDLYMSAPSEAAFVEVTEAWLLSKEKKEIQEKMKKEEARKKKEADQKLKREKAEAKREQQEARKEDDRRRKEERAAQKAEEKRRATEEKEQLDMQRQQDRADAKAAKQRAKEAELRGDLPSEEEDAGPWIAGQASAMRARTGGALAAEEAGESDDEGRWVGADGVDEDADVGPSAAGPGGGGLSAGRSQGGAGGEAGSGGSTGEEAHLDEVGVGLLDGGAGEAGPSGDVNGAADAGPSGDHVDAGDNPDEARAVGAGEAAGGAGGGADEGPGGFSAGNEVYAAVLDEDDQARPVLRPVALLCGGAQPVRWTKRVQLVRGRDEACPLSTGGKGGVPRCPAPCPPRCDQGGCVRVCRRSPHGSFCISMTLAHLSRSLSLSLSPSLVLPAKDLNAFLSLSLSLVVTASGLTASLPLSCRSPTDRRLSTRPTGSRTRSGWFSGGTSRTRSRWRRRATGVRCSSRPSTRSRSSTGVSRTRSGATRSRSGW